MLNKVDRRKRQNEAETVTLTKDPNPSRIDTDYLLRYHGAKIAFDEVEAATGGGLQLGDAEVSRRDIPRWLDQELMYIKKEGRLIPDTRYKTLYKAPCEQDNGN